MEFKLPELGEGVHEGELLKWHVKPGDSVKFDQPLCEIMTDKATMEIPSPFQGTVGQLTATEGKVVHVGQTMLSYDGAGTSASAGASNASDSGSPTSSGAKPATASAAVGAAPNGAPQNTPATNKVPSFIPSGVEAGENIATRVLAAPSTRKFARESGIDLGQVQASGPGGRVMHEDVVRFSQGGAASAGRTASSGTSAGAKSAIGGLNVGLRRGGVGEERVPFKGLRKKISEKMRLSKDHAAHFTYVEEADATELVKLRNTAKELGAKQGIKVTYLPFIMKAMASCLRQYPILNSSLDEEKQEIVYKHYVNIGLSIQTEEGLTAPVIKDVAFKTVLELAKEIQDLVDRARHRKLTLDDLQGGTITLTNAGSIGGLFATPVINYPEVAILGFNKIFRKPVVKTVEGQESIVIRDWTYFSISLDHRVVDGAVGAEFMNHFIRVIENPALLLLESF